MRYITDIEMETFDGKHYVNAVVLAKTFNLGTFRFKVADTGGDYEWCKASDLSKDILGVDDAYIFRLSDVSFKLRGLLYFIEDLDKYDDIPDEIFHMNTAYVSYTKKLVDFIYTGAVPHTRQLLGQDTVFLPYFNSHYVDRGTACVPEDWIIHYFSAYRGTPEDTQSVINNIKHSVYSGIDAFAGRGSYTDYKFDDDYVYRLHDDACFQNIHCPLYVSGDGDLYLGYSSYLEMVGALHYRVRDMAQFKRLITKSVVLGVAC